MMWRLYCSLSQPCSYRLKCVAWSGIMIGSGTWGLRAHSESIRELCRKHGNKPSIVLTLQSFGSYLSTSVFPEHFPGSGFQNVIPGCISEGAILFCSKRSLNNIYAGQSMMRRTKLFDSANVPSKNYVYMEGPFSNYILWTHWFQIMVNLQSIH